MYFLWQNDAMKVIKVNLVYSQKSLLPPSCMHVLSYTTFAASAQSAHKLELEDLQAFVDHVCVNLEKKFPEN